MLILTRKESESITITTPSGESIEITLIETNRGNAKVGVSAPEEYSIVRNELI